VRFESGLASSARIRWHRSDRSRGQRSDRIQV